MQDDRVILKISAGFTHVLAVSGRYSVPVFAALPHVFDGQLA